MFTNCNVVSIFQRSNITATKLRNNCESFAPGLAPRFLICPNLVSPASLPGRNKRLSGYSAHANLIFPNLVSPASLPGRNKRLGGYSAHANSFSCFWFCVRRLRRRTQNQKQGDQIIPKSSCQPCSPAGQAGRGPKRRCPIKRPDL